MVPTYTVVSVGRLTSVAYRRNEARSLCRFDDGSLLALLLEALFDWVVEKRHDCAGGERRRERM